MKKVCGVAAEYNPFHNGHRRHLAETARLLGGDCALVCVMSGNFVQRGESAVWEKHLRAEAALRCGADLVLELPLPWALSSAEGFAMGAVSLLHAAGVVTHMSFGSEAGAAEPLEEIAALLLCPELDGALREELARGVSYAAARQRAAERLAGRSLEPLRRPNDLLGIEYCKALRRLGSGIRTLALPRRGAAHDAREECEGSLSASALRQRLRRGEDIAAYIPPEALRVFAREPPSDPDRLEIALLSRLRMLSPAHFAALPDAGEGLENRLWRAAGQGAGWEEIISAAATKRYPQSRLRRMLWGAALGLRREDTAGTLPPYLRVLGANAAGRELLAEMRTRAALPVLTRPATVRGLDAFARRVFSLEAAATDLWRLGCADPAQRQGDAEWRSAPVMLEAGPG